MAIEILGGGEDVILHKCLYDQNGYQLNIWLIFAVSTKFRVLWLKLCYKLLGNIMQYAHKYALITKYDICGLWRASYFFRGKLRLKTASAFQIWDYRKNWNALNMRDNILQIPYNYVHFKNT